MINAILLFQKLCINLPNDHDVIRCPANYEHNDCKREKRGKNVIKKLFHCVKNPDSSEWESYNRWHSISDASWIKALLTLFINKRKQV